jgi:mRNA interferase MazF
MDLVKRPAPRRGEVWLVSLDPTVGSEIHKARPCLVVSPDAMNQHLRTVTAMPLTSGSRPAPFRIAARFDGRDGLLLADQVRTVDGLRLVRRLGAIDPPTLEQALAIFREMFED